MLEGFIAFVEPVKGRLYGGRKVSGAEHLPGQILGERVARS
jgi:hypothetical protein